MTIYRCRPLNLDEVRYIGVSSVDPHGIGIEVQAGDGSYVLDIYKWRDGRSTTCLGSAESAFEIDLDDLNRIIARCLSDLSDWEAKLRVPDGPWAKEDTA